MLSSLNWCKNQQNTWWVDNTRGNKGETILETIFVKRKIFIEDRPSIEEAWWFSKVQHIL